MSIAVRTSIGETLVSLDDLEATILDHVGKKDFGLDRLVEELSQYSWNQVFHAVDRLARLGSITLRRHGFEYTIARAHRVSRRHGSADWRLLP